jgi:Bacteriophage related domain of unknown function
MTIGLEPKIFRALTDHLDIFATNNTLLIAKPGLPFSPSSATAYLRAYIMPSMTESMDITGLINEYRGIFQVNVFYPEGAGIMVPFESAAALCEHFTTGTLVTHQATTFSILSPPHIGPAIEEPGWIMLPVSIRYRAFLTP